MNLNLSVKEIIALQNALSSLDGEQKVVATENGGSKTVLIPYQFGGKTRWAIVKNMGILKKHVENFSKARDALINEISAGTGVIKETDEQSIEKLNRGLSEILEAQQSVNNLSVLSEDSLNLDVNQIPVTTLTVLTPLIE